MALLFPVDSSIGALKAQGQLRPPYLTFLFHSFYPYSVSHGRKAVALVHPVGCGKGDRIC